MIVSTLDRRRETHDFPPMLRTPPFDASVLPATAPLSGSGESPIFTVGTVASEVQRPRLAPHKSPISMAMRRVPQGPGTGRPRPSA